MGKHTLQQYFWQGVNIQNLSQKLIQLNTRKNNVFEKWAKDLNQYFSKENIQMVNRCMKRGPMSLIISVMQIKTTIRYYFILVRMAIINQSTNKCWWEYREKGNPCALLVGLQIGATTVKSSFLKKLKIKWPYNPTIICKDKCTPMFIEALFTIAKIWKQLKCPSTYD